MLGKGHIGGIFHNILNPFHIGAHFLERLPRGNQRHRGGNERRKKALKRHDHTDGKQTFHRQETACHQHGRSAKGAYQSRQQLKKQIGALIPNLICIDACLIAGPFFKKAVFGAAGLDGLDHLDA